ncbi:hypothetical protein THAOC_20590, partial [Thalassiosira oceanica]
PGSVYPASPNSRYVAQARQSERSARPATLAEDTVHELQAVAWTPRSSDASARYLTLGEPASTPFELGSGGPTYKQAKGLPRPPLAGSPPHLGAELLRQPTEGSMKVNEVRTNCAWSPPGSPLLAQGVRNGRGTKKAGQKRNRKRPFYTTLKTRGAKRGAPFRLIFGRMRAQVSYPYSALSQSKRCTSWPAFLEPVLRPQIMAPPRPSITPSLHSTTLRQAYYQADRHRSQREYSYSIHLHRRSSETSLRFASSLKYQMASSAGDKSLSRCKGSRQVRLGDETHQDDARVAEATGERRRQHQT